MQIHGFHHSNNTGPHDRDICPCSCYNSSLFIRFRASELIQKLCSIDFASGVSNPQRVLTMQMFSDLGRASGTEQEYLLLKAKVKHGRAWSPNGWVAICARLCDHPEIFLSSHSVQPAKVLRMRL